TVDELDMDLRDLREGEDRVALPVDAGHPRAIEGDLLLEGAAHRLDDVALDLLAHALRIDDLASVVSDEETLHPDLAAAAVDLDVIDRRHVGAHQLIFDIGDAATGCDIARGGEHRGIALRFPFGERRKALEHLLPARVLEIA